MTSEMEDRTACMYVYEPKDGGIESVTGACYGSLTVLGLSWRKAGMCFAKNWVTFALCAEKTIMCI